MLTFKEELKAYKGWVKQLKKIDEEIYTLEYDMAGVKGVDLTKQGGTTNPQIKTDHRHDMSERLEFLKNERVRIAMNIEHVLYVLGQIEDEESKKIINDVMIEHKTYAQASVENYLSESQTYKRVNKIIKKL